MKRTLLTTIFALGLVVSFGQTKHFRVGFSFYPNISQTLYAGNPEIEWMVELQKERERAKFNLGGNVFVERALNKRLSFRIGLGYTSYGEQTGKYKSGFTFPDTLDPFYGFVNPGGNANLPDEIKFIYTVHSIEVPLQIRYIFWRQFYAQGGASLLGQFRATKTQWSKSDGESANRDTETNTQETINPVNLGLNAGVGYTFFAKAPVQWFVALNSQFVAFGVMQDVNLNRKYISAGITTGIVF